MCVCTGQWVFRALTVNPLSKINVTRESCTFLGISYFVTVGVGVLGLGLGSTLTPPLDRQCGTVRPVLR